MIIFGIVPIRFPFLQLPPAPDLRFEQLVPQAGDVIAEFLVIAQNIGGLDGVGEQVVDDFLIVSHTFFSGAVLGRPSLGRDKGAVRPSFQVVVPKLADLLEHRIGGLAEIGRIATKGEMLPEMLGIPRAAGRVPFPK